MIDFAARVTSGAALLDVREPGWFNHINLNNLDMHCPCLCVLGQLHGRYYDGISFLGLEACIFRVALAVLYGFTLSSEELEDSEELPTTNITRSLYLELREKEAWVKLSAQWEDAIRARRAIATAR